MKFDSEKGIAVNTATRRHRESESFYIFIISLLLEIQEFSLKIFFITFYILERENRIRKF